MQNRTYLLIATTLLMLGSACTQQILAEVTLPSVIGSHMVLQRNSPLPVWGWADPGEQITVEITGNRESTKADTKGRWKVVLSPMKTQSTPLSMTIRGSNTINLENILIGDVWFGSGQSNMQMPMLETGVNAREIAAAHHPQIRLLQVTQTKASVPQENVEANWEVCSPASVGQFSAALYYFGRRLKEELKVPIGLINSSWGGSKIEWWMAGGGQHIDNDKASEMHNGMIAPLQPFAVRGFLWYQGEANVYYNKGMNYQQQMERLVAGWRKAWGYDKPFYFVQLAPWNYSGYPPGRLPSLWENQVACLKIPNTGMVVTVDLSDPSGLETGHPENKIDVGERLALWALAKTYERKDQVYCGPLYKAIEIRGNNICVHFSNVHGGLKSRDGEPLREFQIAGNDSEFVPAQARVEGETVLVSAEGIDAPTQVRFAWHKLCNPNLSNGAGLPASPFQTNNWQGATTEQ